MILPSKQKSSGGGHTILNGSGTAMTQRSKLQFDGLNVTDDSGNDKTVVTAPTPDYVDEQFNSSKTYSKGMTCIEGNVRYRYKNSTATSGHRPPDTTYWEVFSVASEIGTVSATTLSGGIFVKNGKMRMLTYANTGERSVAQFYQDVAQYIPQSEYPSKSYSSIIGLITVSGGSWSLEIGQIVVGNSGIAIYESGAIISTSDQRLLVGQIIWYID